MDNPQFLQYFHDLADGEKHCRAKAAVGLVTVLDGVWRKRSEIKIKDEKDESTGSSLGRECFPDLEYALDRIVKGLASSRGCCRQGFSSAFIHILKHFSGLLGIISIDAILKLITRHLSDGGLKGSREHALGRFFALLAIIESGILIDKDNKAFNDVSGRSKAIKDTCKGLFDVFESKVYLREAATQATLGLVKSLCETSLRQIIGDICSIWKIGDDGEITDINQVGFALAVRKLVTENDNGWPSHLMKPLTTKYMSKLLIPLFQALQPQHHEISFPWSYQLLCETLWDMAKTGGTFDKHIELLVQSIDTQLFNQKAAAAAHEKGLQCLVYLCAYGPSEAFYFVMQSQGMVALVNFLKSSKSTLLQKSHYTMQRLRAIYGFEKQGKSDDWGYGVNRSTDPALNDKKYIKIWKKISNLPDFNGLAKRWKLAFFQIILNRVSSDTIESLTLHQLQQTQVDPQALHRFALHPQANDNTIRVSLCTLFVKSFCKIKSEKLSLQEFCNMDVTIEVNKLTDLQLNHWRDLFWGLLHILMSRTSHDSKSGEEKEPHLHEGQMKDKKSWIKLMIEWWDYLVKNGWKMQKDVRPNGAAALRQEALNVQTKGPKRRALSVLKQLHSTLALGVIGNEKGGLLFAEIQEHWQSCSESGNWKKVLDLLPALFINSQGVVKEAVRACWRDFAVTSPNFDDCIEELIKDLDISITLDVKANGDDEGSDSDNESGTDSDDIGDDDEPINPKAGQTDLNQDIEDIILEGEDTIFNHLLDDTDEVSKMAQAWSGGGLGEGDQGKENKRLERNQKMQTSLEQKMMVLELLDLYISQNGQNPLLEKILLPMFNCFHRHHYYSKNHSRYSKQVLNLQGDLARKIGAICLKMIKGMAKLECLPDTGNKVQEMLNAVPKKARHPMISTINCQILVWILEVHEKTSDDGTKLTTEIIEKSLKEWMDNNDQGKWYETIIRYYADKRSDLLLTQKTLLQTLVDKKQFIVEQILHVISSMLRNKTEGEDQGTMFAWKDLAKLCYDMLPRQIENTKQKEKYRSFVLRHLADALRHAPKVLGEKITNLEKIRDSCPHKKGPVYQTSLYAIRLATQDEPRAPKQKKRQRENTDDKEVAKSSSEPASEPLKKKKKEKKRDNAIEKEAEKQSSEIKDDTIQPDESTVDSVSEKKKKKRQRGSNDENTKMPNKQGKKQE